MPYTTVRKRLQGNNFDTVNVILASARSTQSMKAAELEIKSLLLDRHSIAPGEPADFEVANTTEIANVFGIITGTMTMLLAAIAGVSLMVGGVGIMNIMLVSVTSVRVKSEFVWQWVPGLATFCYSFWWSRSSYR